MVAPLIHKNPKATDEELVAEANAHFKGNRKAQFVARVVELMRKHQFPGMTYKDLHAAFPAIMRMGWLQSRPDRRQQIFLSLAGGTPNRARNRKLASQAEDIEEAIKEGDRNFEQYDNEFPSDDMALYGDRQAILHLLFNEIDWTDITNETKQAVIAELINELLTAEPGLKPILTHHEVRRAISTMEWNRYVPPELRAQVDDARLEKEEKNPKVSFSTEEEFKIIPPEKFVKPLGLENLRNVLATAIIAMGFKDPREVVADEKSADAEANKPTAPPPASNDGPNAPPDLEVTVEPEAKATKPKPPQLPPRARLPGIEKPEVDEEIAHALDGLELPPDPKG